MSLHDFKRLIRALENAAWDCGKDEYRDGVSYTTTKRHGDALDTAKKNLNDAAEGLFTKLKERETMNTTEAARSMTFNEYRQWWYKQLGETPPEPVNDEWTVGQARDERLIRQGYNHRNGLPLEPKQQATGGSGKGTQ